MAQQTIELTYLKATGYFMMPLSTHFDHGTGVMEISEMNLLYHTCIKIEEMNKHEQKQT